MPSATISNARFKIEAMPADNSRVYFLNLTNKRTREGLISGIKRKLLIVMISSRSN